jgi:hypothetical protein
MVALANGRAIILLYWKWQKLNLYFTEIHIVSFKMFYSVLEIIYQICENIFNQFEIMSEVFLWNLFENHIIEMYVSLYNVVK